MARLFTLVARTSGGAQGALERGEELVAQVRGSLRRQAPGALSYGGYAGKSATAALAAVQKFHGDVAGSRSPRPATSGRRLSSAPARAPLSRLGAEWWS